MERIPINAGLGIALGQAISGSPVTIYPGMPLEMEDLIQSYKPLTAYSFGHKRRDIDLDEIRNSDMIMVDPFDRERVPPLSIPELRNGKDVIKLVALLREISDVPIIYAIDAMDVQKDLDFLLVSDVDALMIRALGSRYDHRPDITMVTSMIRTNKQMEVFQSRKRGLRIAANGIPRDPQDMLKLIALGADLIGMDNLTMVFLRTYLSIKINEKDIIDEDLEDHDKDLDWAEIGELFGEYLTLLKKEIIEGFTFLNIHREKGISMDEIDTSDYSTASITGLHLEGFGGPVPIWRHRS
jgi:hypothetical protein